MIRAVEQFVPGRTVRVAHQLRRAKPSIASLPVDALERSRDLKREGNVIDRQATNVQSLMVENRFWHPRSFEYEYEYRCTEYEYECADQPRICAAEEA